VDQPLFRRTTYLCADAERMADFYAAVFGMTRWYDHTLAVDSRFPPTGAASGAPARLIVMQAEDPTVGMIGFLQFLDPPPGSAPLSAPADGRVRVGDTVKVFNCADVEAAHARALAAGAVIATPPTVWAVPAREGGGETRLKMFCFFDPEGHYCEASQRL
jgi:catechol 2,3-dioxygenase-like lactoylglutathione lyase family enzyme